MAHYMTGPDPGTISVYRALGGWYPGNLVRSVTNTTTEWVTSQFPLVLDDLRPDLSHEVCTQLI